MNLKINDIKTFFESMEHYIAKVLLKELDNVERVYNGTVSEIDGSFANVVLSAERGETGFIPNKTGETLTAGDAVRVYVLNDNFGNAYIGLKYS